jgi:hypothetical protein
MRSCGGSGACECSGPRHARRPPGDGRSDDGLSGIGAYSMPPSLHPTTVDGRRDEARYDGGMAGRSADARRHRRPRFVRRRRRQQQQRQERHSLLVAVLTGLAAFAVLIVVVVIEQEPPIATIEPGNNDPVHAHGLGLNPADDALLVATHLGLYRTPPDKSHLERVGDRLHDTMAFTVAGPDHFLASGHPDMRGLEEGMPPLLGLIESRDGGRTWEPISLAGEADFHVLRLRGKRIYGYDAANGRLLVSLDRGRTWNQRNAPGEVVDLAADPANGERLLASTTEGLAFSEDGGRAWERLGASRGLLAWPAARALYLVAPDGVVYASADGGRSLTPRADVGGKPAAMFAASETDLFVALHDGTVKVSRDGGLTWNLRSLRSA